jgi:uncharacterized protein (TIGR03435 family)
MRLQLVHIACCTALAFVAAETMLGQAEQVRSFDVASVRLAGPQTQPFRRVTDTRVDLTNISLQTLLLRAFQLDEPSRLSAPDWVTGVRVDVHATIPRGSSREHVPEMLKTLLITRFGLRAHSEPRLTDVYELVVSSGGVRVPEVMPVNDLERAFPAVPSGSPPSSIGLQMPLRVKCGASPPVMVWSS